MRKESPGKIRIIPFSILIAFLLAGCMRMGMKRDGPMMESIPSSSPDQEEEIKSRQALDQIIEEAVLDLSNSELDINSVAVWQIRSQTAGLDVEVIRQKLISKLVPLNLFKVVSRERLNELLEEQGLSLSGTIDERSAVEIGKLISVEGFIDGYASVEDSRFILSLTLIETKSGLIIWAKTFEVPIHS
ncbi:MAG: CsgG/HfaB family protein [Candidatus Neomarinimicrobiota bacterium]